MEFSLSVIDWNTISAISSILAFIGILITIREMKMQRNHTYLPSLVISKPNFVVQNNLQGIPTIWKNKFNDINDDEMWFYLSICNIGFGAANEVEIDWIIDTNKIREMLNNVNKEKIFIIENNGNSFHYSYKGYGFFIDDTSRDYNERLPFLVNGQTDKIILPMTIKNYLSFYYLGLIKTISAIQTVETEMPVKIKISCLDMTGEKKVQIYKMKYDIYIRNENFDLPLKDIIYGRIMFIKDKKHPTPASTL